MFTFPQLPGQVLDSTGPVLCSDCYGNLQPIFKVQISAYIYTIELQGSPDNTGEPPILNTFFSANKDEAFSENNFPEMELLGETAKVRN